MPARTLGSPPSTSTLTYRIGRRSACECAQRSTVLTLTDSTTRADCLVTPPPRLNVLRTVAPAMLVTAWPVLGTSERPYLYTLNIVVLLCRACCRRATWPSFSARSGCISKAWI